MQYNWLTARTEELENVEYLGLKNLSTEMVTDLQCVSRKQNHPKEQIKNPKETLPAHYYLYATLFECSRLPPTYMCSALNALSSAHIL